MKATITRPKPVEPPPAVVTLEMNEVEAKVLRTLISGVGSVPLNSVQSNETTRALNGIRGALQGAGICQDVDFKRAFEIKDGYVFARPALANV